MTDKRFINDVSEILDTYFGYMGTEEPSEREIKEKDYLLVGVARSQRDAENICEKLNEQNEELISYCNFSLHDLLDKKNKEIEQLKQAISDWKGSYDELYQDIKILEKENKELKAKVDDKEVAVEVECEKLMQKVFNLINAKIKLYSHKPVSAPISQPMSVNFDADVDRLARLSELEALKEELEE